MKLLEIKNLSKSYGELQVLKDITFDVSEGEVVAIIGPSGSGKSTLLRCATMLEKISGGEIYCKGEKMAETVGGAVRYANKASLKKIRSYFGLVFQNFNLFPHMSVQRNVTEALTVNKKVPKAEAVKTAQKLLIKMGLGDKAESYPCQLSGGQQQRVSIARALALNPDILYFDEPTSALDPEITGEILKVIKELAAEKMTMVIVTHEISFARNVANRVVFMDGGVIVEQGRPEEVIDNPSSPRTKAFLSHFSN